MRKGSILGKLFSRKKRDFSFDISILCQENQPLYAKMELAQSSQRPRYTKTKEIYPITVVKSHQLARIGKLHGVPKHKGQ